MNNQEAIEQLRDIVHDLSAEFSLSCADRLAFEMAFMALEQTCISEDEALLRVREDEN